MESGGGRRLCGVFCFQSIQIFGSFGVMSQQENSKTEKKGGLAAGSVEPPYPESAHAWYAVGVLMVFYILSFVDRQIIALLVEPMKADLGLSDVEMSLLGGLSFVVFYTFFGIPLGRLADHHSRRGLIAVGVAFWSLMTAMCGVAHKFWQLLVFRMGVGIGEATLSPAAYSLIADYFPREKRATALSVYGMGIYFGSGLAFLGGAILLAWAVGLVESRGGEPFPIVGAVRPWQIVLFAVGLPGLVLTPLLLTIKEPCRRGVTAIVGDASSNGLKGIPLGEVVAHMKANWRAVVLHNVGLAFLSLAGYSSGFWDAAFFERAHDWKPQDSGIWYGLLTMTAGASGVLCGGWLSDMLAARGVKSANMLTIFLAAVAWFPFGIGYLFMPNIGLTLTLLFPALFTAAMPFGCAAAAIQEMMPPQMRGQASAVYLFTINIIGLGIGPTAVALLTERLFRDLEMVNFSLALTAGTGHLLAAILLWMSLGPYKECILRTAAWKPKT